MEKTGDFYDLLGVHKKASGEEIRAKYHELARLFHPDRVPNKDKEIAHRVFVRINQAYSTLIDPEQRERYDRRRAARQAGRAQPAKPSPSSASPPKPAPAPPPSPEEIRAWMTQASEAHRRGDIEGAHTYLRRIIKSGRAPVEAYILIGDIYIHEHQRPKALTAYRVALKLQPDNKMLQAKVRRLHEFLHGAPPQAEPSVSEVQRQDNSAGKRSLLSRISDMRPRKQ